VAVSVACRHAAQAATMQPIRRAALSTAMEVLMAWPPLGAHLHASPLPKLFALTDRAPAAAPRG
jgi:hypothetical protein